MKIGINTYISANKFSLRLLIGTADVELSNDEVITAFGDILKYNELSRLIESPANPEKELFILKLGKIDLYFFKLG